MKTIKISKEHIISSDEEFVTIKVEHNEISDLYLQISELEGEVGDLANEVSYLEKEINNLEDEISILDEKIGSSILISKNIREKAIIELFEKVLKDVNYIEIETTLENLLSSDEKN